MPLGIVSIVVKHDPTLMEFDLPLFHSLLAEAIHGGPAMVPQLMRAWRQQAGLAVPFRVVAILFASGTPQNLSAQSRAATVLQVHPGLAYLCTSAPLTGFAKMFAPRHLLVGESREAENEYELTATIQKAIIALRQKELAEFGRRRGTSVDQAAEQQARHLALQALRTGDDTSALSVWVDIVVLRHQASLNTVRRKAVEMLTLLTADLDHAAAVAYPFRQAMDSIYRTFALSDLARVIITVISTVALEVRRTVSIPAINDPLIQRARDILRQGATGPISIANVATDLHVSAAHLSRRFKAITGEPPLTFLSRVRLQHAQERLRDSDDGILAIALASGFGSLEHFHRTFKTATGMTPGKWRHRHLP